MSGAVTIIGAGLAGLTCARELAAKGIAVEVLEASDGVGGRVRTDTYEGFLLDRGFQVLLTAYPECRRALDYQALDLKKFYPGALVRLAGAFHRLADPMRHPLDAMASVKTPIGTFMDKVRVAGLAASDGPEMTTLAKLQSRHLSDAMIDRFFRAFFGGIFLERELATSSLLFDFIFRMFAEGDTAVPAAGMEAIPRQLAVGLPISLNTRVLELPGGTVVVAADEPEAARLLGTPPPKPGKGVSCFYFAADKSPLEEGILVLDGDGKGPVNNCCVMSDVAPSYAPAGASLISASVLGAAQQGEVLSHLTEWFGPQVSRWIHLRTAHVGYAQPDQQPPLQQRPVRVRKGLYVCGDYIENASINGAMASGRRAAEAVLQDLS